MPHVSVHTDPRMTCYGFMRGSAPGGRHYYSSDRFAAFYKEFLARSLDTRVELVPASPLADERELGLLYSAEFLRFVRSRCQTGEGSLDRGPIKAERGMDIVAAAVAGCVLHGLKRILAGETERAFIPISGFHHGRPDQALDYCIYNDAALAIAWMRVHHPELRIGYVDIDAHFGNGVHELFKEDGSVRLIDLHQDSRGRLETKAEFVATGSTRIISLPAGATDEDMFAHWSECRTWLVGWNPDLIVFVAGADSLEGDGLASLALSVESHRRITADLAAICPNMLVLGGGGYALWNLGPCWCAVLEALLEQV